MAQAIICPVCMGTGKYKECPYPSNATCVNPIERVCHGCGGRGWVEVGSDEQPWTYPWVYRRIYPPCEVQA